MHHDMVVVYLPFPFKNVVSFVRNPWFPTAIVAELKVA